MSKQPNYQTFNPNFELDRSKIENFLRTFESKSIQADSLHRQHKYMIELQKIANKESKVLELHTEDLEAFFEKENDSVLLEAIIRNMKRYIQLVYEAADKLMPQPNKKLSPEETIEPIDEILMHHRMETLAKNDEQNRTINPIEKKNIPNELLRRYEAIIVPGSGSKLKLTPMRQLKADQLGGLTTIQGIVVRATDVKPFIKVACYSCEVCGCEIYQVINNRTFMPLVDCTSDQCRNNNSHGKITQSNRTSKFLSFQEIKIQEPTHQVPVGHVPRSLTIFALGQCVRQCVPGDTVTIHGIYLPSVITGTHAFKSRLIHDTYVEAFKIVKEKKSYKDTSLSDEMIEKMTQNKKKKQENAYTNLSRSIAPEIFGMEDIKKALLLLLVGGVDKETEDGMKIRGNINVLLMGDPGIAKSQLLKYISNISPRGVYTTGKGSSGVGLTAAVVKDPITNDLVLEGGALVLADMGVCCIDEFDKMSDYDRANIHEVMEQQTVSIAKAGITTRLNARASVLAAANPLYGRYDQSKTPHENINLPAALLSRFDLIFLLLDIPNAERDFELAKHVAYVHKHNKPPELTFEPYNAKFIRSYIAVAKQNTPVIPKDLHNFIIQKYVEKRRDEADKSKQGYQYITPRSLLAIIRLAQALAKLRMNEKVEQSDVDEALRLVEISKSSIEPIGKDDKPVPQVRNDTKSVIYNIVRELCAKNELKTAAMDVIERKVLAKGFKKRQLENMLEDYVNLNILYVDQNGTEVTLL